MKIITSLTEWNEFRRQLKDETFGLIPTMGYLHDGHASLIRRANQENSITVVSVFVNPLQFGPNEDFEKYPRDLARDASIAEEAGADLLFAPGVEDIYPGETYTKVTVSSLTDRLCGASRPGHFDGVATVVSKLLNIVRPDRIYFGMKDAQQVAVINQMVNDLNINVQVVKCETVRESDGLAKSSRNVFLSDEERTQALVLHRAIQHVRDAWQSGERNVERLRQLAEDTIASAPLATIDYVEILKYPELSVPEAQLKGDYLLAMAVFFGKTRLIDNTLLTAEVK